MLSWTCPLMSLSSSSVLELAEGLRNKSSNNCLCLSVRVFKQFFSRFRFQRGLKRKPMALIKKLRKAVCETIYDIFLLLFKML